MQLSVSYERSGNVHTIHTGGAALGDIVIDNGPVPEEEQGGTAKQLIGAAALFCYASALNSAMEARGLSCNHLSLGATLDVGANSKGQSRVLKIAVVALADIDEEDLDLFERVARVMKNGCLVTSSLHDGIEMTYELKASCEDDE